MIPVYNIDNINSISNEHFQFVINDQLFLETLLMNIRGKTISYSSYKKKKSINKEKTLIKEIREIEQSLTQEKVETLESKQIELDKLRKEKMNGIYIRSRATWLNEGEKPSKYFLRLESNNYTKK